MFKTSFNIRNLKRSTIKELKDLSSRELAVTKFKPNLTILIDNQMEQNNKRNVLVEQTKTHILSHANVSITIYFSKPSQEFVVP